MKSQRSVMAHKFSEVPRAEIQRSKFDRSHGLKTTFDSGYIIPIFVDEALPGDTFNLDMTAFARLATPIKPVMDNLFLETFFFSVPNRLLWDNWERFNGAQTNPDDSIDFVIPTINSGAPGFVQGSLFDYMGIPPSIHTVVNALHFRAFNLIYNEWFRDENLQDSADILTNDGPDFSTNYPMRRRGKRHDYFTSALPWPQKGDPVTVPLGVSAPVVPTSPGASFEWGVSGSGASSAVISVASTNVVTAIPDGQVGWGDVTGLETDLTSATAVTINSLRQGFQVQRLLERDARGGTRYTEIIRAHFGVHSPDARLQRPEYLGGGSTQITFVPVAQTTPDDGGAATPQANLAAIATAAVHRHGFTKSFTEHSVILGFVNVRADLTYQQGLNRMWSRSTRYDFYWPALAHIGEQTILNKEIFLQDFGTAENDEVFGYQERYAEYRYKPSQITGKFRSTDPQSLDIWHLSQDFATLPVLNASFIEDEPPIPRIIAVQDEPQFLFDAFFKLTCARPMPLYGVPGLIDHF